MIYPAGLVTGYYGPLTKDAVRNFQVSQGISAVGRVGPLTMARINEIIVSGRGLDVSAPRISDVGVTVSGRTASVFWKTDESVLGKVFYDVKPIAMFEQSTARTEPSVSGSVFRDSSWNAQKSMLLGNLSSNTVYHMAVMSIDQSGNVSVGQERTFITGN